MSMSLVLFLSLFLMRTILNFLLYSLLLLILMSSLQIFIIYFYLEDSLQRIRSPTLNEIRLGGKGQLLFQDQLYFLGSKMYSWKRLDTNKTLWITLLRYSIISLCRFLTILQENLPQMRSSSSIYPSPSKNYSILSKFDYNLQLSFQMFSIQKLIFFFYYDISLSIVFLYQGFRSWMISPFCSLMLYERFAKQFFSNFFQSYSNHLVSILRMAGCLILILF